MSSMLFLGKYGKLKLGQVTLQNYHNVVRNMEYNMKLVYEKV